MRSPQVVAALAALVALTLTACGADDVYVAPADAAPDALLPEDATADHVDAALAPDVGAVDAPPDVAVDAAVANASADAGDAAVVDGGAKDAGQDAEGGAVSSWTVVHGGFVGEPVSIAIAATLPPDAGAPDAGGAPPMYVLAAKQGVYKSTDTGSTWSLANGAVDPAKASFNALALHPTDPDSLVLAQSATTTPHVWLTGDGAASWKGVDITVPSATDYELHALRIVPDVGILAGAYSLGSELPWVLVAGLDGASWAPSATSGTTFNFVPSITGSSGSLLLAPVNAGTASTGGIYRSTDGKGATWSEVTTGIDALDAANTFSIAQALSDPQTIYVGILPPNVVGMVSMTTLFKSTDGGVHWALANTGLPSYAAVLSIAVHPTNPSIAYAACTGEGVYKTTDGGGHWQYSGLVGLGLHVVAIDPVSPNIVFAGGTPDVNATSGLYVTMTGG